MRLLQLLFFALFIQVAEAQQPGKPALSDDPAFTTILSRQITYPVEAARSGRYAKIYAAFRIDHKGHIQEVSILNPVKTGSGLEEEVLKKIKRLPSLNPHYEGDYVLPVSFGFVSKTDSTTVIRSSGHLPGSYFIGRTLLNELLVTTDRTIYQADQIILPAKANGQSFILN